MMKRLHPADRDIVEAYAFLAVLLFALALIARFW
jgi:hypothetical protein